MSTGTKKWLIAATILIAVGAVIFIGTMASLDFNFTKLSTEKYETNMYEIDEAFENISIDVQTTTISLIPSDDEICKVECFEEKKVKHSVSVQDGSLIIDTIDNRKWYDHIGIVFENPKIIIYLPKDTYTFLIINASTGNIDIPDSFDFENIHITGSTSKITCYASVSKNIEINTSTGGIFVDSSETERIKICASTAKIELNDILCNELAIQNNTGNINLTKVIAKDYITVKNSTGNVLLKDCDAEEIFIKTSTGNVTGTLLSTKTFVTDTSTGKISVPKSTTGGKCEIMTSTGNIAINYN